MVYIRVHLCCTVLCVLLVWHLGGWRGGWLSIPGMSSLPSSSFLPPHLSIINTFSFSGFGRSFVKDLEVLCEWLLTLLPI